MDTTLAIILIVVAAVVGAAVGIFVGMGLRKKFAEKEQCKVEKYSLVKMTQAEIKEIWDAKSSGMEAIYYDDSYVYLINDDGTDGNFKGFEGNLNKKVDAPYIVATGHTKEDWEKFEKEQNKEEEKDEQKEEDKAGADKSDSKG